MDAVAHAHDAHAPTRAGQYVRIGLVLAVLTALEVGAYEIAHREGAPLHDLLKQGLIPVLIVLSAIKFALVASYYMHLKWDGPLLKGIFTFSLIIAAVVILALLGLFMYHYKFAATIAGG